MDTIMFRPINRYASRSGKCPVCGRRTVRRRKFTETVNPFHRAVNPGMTMTEATQAVAASVSEAVAAWQPDFTHEKCREGE